MIIELLFSVFALSAADAARHEVICAETGFSRAAERRDKDAFLAFVDEDARFVGRTVSRGRDEIGQAWRRVFEPDGPSMRWRPAVVDVTADGQLAISTGPYRSIRTNDEGETVESWGTFISTWRRNSEGRWRVVFDTSGEIDMTPTERDIEILDSEPECPES